MRVRHNINFTTFGTLRLITTAKGSLQEPLYNIIRSNCPYEGDFSKKAAIIDKNLDFFVQHRLKRKTHPVLSLKGNRMRFRYFRLAFRRRAIFRTD